MTYFLTSILCRCASHCTYCTIVQVTSKNKSFALYSTKQHAVTFTQQLAVARVVTKTDCGFSSYLSTWIAQLKTYSVMTCYRPAKYKCCILREHNCRADRAGYVCTYSAPGRQARICPRRKLKLPRLSSCAFEGDCGTGTKHIPNPLVVQDEALIMHSLTVSKEHPTV